MSDKEFECPACRRFGYDPGYSCGNCGYSRAHGITPDVQTKLDALAYTATPEPRHELKTTRSQQLQNTPTTRIGPVEAPPPVNRSFAARPEFMVQRDKQMKEAWELESRRYSRRSTAADNRSRPFRMPPEVTLTKEEFLSASISAFISSESSQRVRTELKDELERYWEINLGGHIARCIATEYRIADYLNTLPPSFRRRVRRIDGEDVATTLISLCATGLKDRLS